MWVLGCVGFRECGWKEETNSWCDRDERRGKVNKAATAPLPVGSSKAVGCLVGCMRTGGYLPTEGAAAARGALPGWFAGDSASAVPVVISKQGWLRLLTR